MKKIRLTGCIFILVLLATFLLIGCGKGDVTGTYQLENNPGRELILYNNGKGVMYTTQFDYSVKDDTILITALDGNTQGTVSRKTIQFEAGKDIFSSLFTGTWKKK